MTLYHSGDQIKKNEIDGHVARMGLRRVAYRLLVGIPRVKRPLGGQDVYGRIILNWIFMGRHELDLFGSE
jgi:hypothetical protein